MKNKKLETLTDPLDFFGAIANLVEQSISPKDIDNYASSTRQRRVDFPSSITSSSSLSQDEAVVTELKTENSHLRGRVPELERALDQVKERSGQMVSTTRSVTRALLKQDKLVRCCSLDVHRRPPRRLV